jgi:hypothetical protein
MAMDTKDMMNEMGAAFAVTWLVMGYTVWTGDAMVSETELVGLGMSGIMAVAALGVAWMAFAGAHILPPVTWMHIMTGDLSDTDAWMANGMKLVMQIVGGLVALLLMSELNAGGVTYDESMTVMVDGVPTVMAMEAWELDPMQLLGGIAAGSILWCIHSKADNAWATAVGVVALSAYIGAESSTGMASMISNQLGDLVPTLLDYLVTGASVGIGALLATKIDEAL